MHDRVGQLPASLPSGNAGPVTHGEKINASIKLYPLLPNAPGSFEALFLNYLDFFKFFSGDPQNIQVFTVRILKDPVNDEKKAGMEENLNEIVAGSQVQVKENNKPEPEKNAPTDQIESEIEFVNYTPIVQEQFLPEIKEPLQSPEAVVENTPVDTESTHKVVDTGIVEIEPELQIQTNKVPLNEVPDSVDQVPTDQAKNHFQIMDNQEPLPVISNVKVKPTETENVNPQGDVPQVAEKIVPDKSIETPTIIAPNIKPQETEQNNTVPRREMKDTEVSIPIEIVDTEEQLNTSDENNSDFMHDQPKIDVTKTVLNVVEVKEPKSVEGHKNNNVPNTPKVDKIESGSKRSTAVIRSNAKEKADFISHIVKAAKLLNTKFVSKLKMVLNPPELGSLKIDLTLKNNSLKAVLLADNMDAKDLILSRSEELKQALSDHGVDLSSFSVTVSDDEKRGFDESGSPGLPAEEKKDEAERIVIKDKDKILDIFV